MEPYSIAMTVLDALPEAAQLNIRILATDLDPVILARAREARFSTEEVRPIPDRMKSWGLGPVEGDHVKVSPKVTDGQPATDDELYVFVRVREVRPAVMPGGNSLPQLEPPPVNSTPKVEVPRVPPIAVPLPVILPVGGTTVASAKEQHGPED